MKVFLYTTDVRIKKEFMFYVYRRPRGNQKEGDAIPLPQLRDILTKELFVRSHWEDVQMANEDLYNSGMDAQIKSAYGDKVMKQALTEIMEQYDTDGN